MDLRVLVFVAFLCMGAQGLLLGSVMRNCAFFHGVFDAVQRVPVDSFKMWYAENCCTADVFENSSLHVVVETSSIPNNKYPRSISGLYMQFCENMDDLLDVYFSNINLEDFQMMWKVLSSSWIPETVAQSFGIQESHLLGQDYGYVVLRVDKESSWSVLNPKLGSPRLLEEVEMQANEIIPGNRTTVKIFIGKYGTHYLSSYATGDALFQVLVYGREEYLAIKAKLQVRGLTKLYVWSQDMLERSGILPSSAPEYVGRIVTLSRRESVEQWAKKNLQVNTARSSYLSMTKLSNFNSSIFMELEGLLSNDETTNLNFRTISSTFQNVKSSNYFTEFLTNCLKTATRKQ